MSGGVNASPHSAAARSRRSSTSSRPSWSARANGGGMIPAPAIIPRSISRSEAIPSSRTRQLSTSAFSVKRSTRPWVSISGAVLIEPLPGLGAQVTRGHELLHLRVDVEAIAVGVSQVLGHVQNRVETEEIGEEEGTHRRRL